MQETFDWLYQRSVENRTRGIDLYNILISEANIMLAYRMIKSNTGSQTAGVDDVTIRQFKIKDKHAFVNEMRETVACYQPQTVRRVEIPKSNGKTRPLGIPTMRDRMVQQMMKQVLEPICEAKFYRHSYGFRPNRSTHHALARCAYLINISHLHYVVDIDIKGFFDNVNHTKLLHQLYRIGIKDRRVLAIIGKMLKAPVSGLGILNKGTPQGAILSPLLSNVVLNDLDHWIASQWEDFPTRHSYLQSNSKQRALRRTNLKEMHIVRYADDFKIFTDNYKSAWKIFHAVIGYLKGHLTLDVSPDKSTITNLRRRRSEFLGFEFEAVKKRQTYVSQTYVSKKRQQVIKERLRRHFKILQRSPSWQNVTSYNAYILGIHNYYSFATHVSADFSDIAYSLLYTQYNRLKGIGKYEIPRSPPPSYRKFYQNKVRTFKIGGRYLFPIADIKWKFHACFSQTVCDYTNSGRQMRYKRLTNSVAKEIRKLQQFHTNTFSTEYTDNRISRYSMQNGKCAVSGYFLSAEEVHCHHILPRKLGGTDDYNNLVVVHELIHRFIHAELPQTIEKYRRLFKLSGKQLDKLNHYRKQCNLSSI